MAATGVIRPSQSVTFAGIIRSQRQVRPRFAVSWLGSPPIDSTAELMAHYEVRGAKVHLYQSARWADWLYLLDPPEAHLTRQAVRLLHAAKDALIRSGPPPEAVLSFRQAEAHVRRHGRELLVSEAERYGLAPSPQDLDGLAALLERHTAGLGMLEYLLADACVEDLYLDAPAGQAPLRLTLSPPLPGIQTVRARSNLQARSEDLLGLLSKIRQGSGRPFSEAVPVLEAALVGHEARVTAIGPPLSPDGVAIALRRHSTEPWTLPRLVRSGMLTAQAAGFLALAVDGQRTLLVAGPRGSGKTALLGALMAELPRAQRTLTIEDTLELPVPALQRAGYAVQRLAIRGGIGGLGELSAEEALRVSLRLGESAVVLGEVRGREAQVLYEGMRTGSASAAVMGTIHGATAQAVLDRVVHDLGVPPEAFAATELIVQLAGRREQGRLEQARRLSSIEEVFVDDEGLVGFVPLFAWDQTRGAALAAERFPSSRTLRRLAAAWSLTSEEACEVAEIRAAIIARLEAPAPPGGPDPCRLEATARANAAYWQAVRQGLRGQELLAHWEREYGAAPR